MSLNRCRISHEALYSCITHALATEHQEVMGLLLGSWTTDDYGQHVEALVRQVVIMARTDRRKDRVEVGMGQLVDVSNLASEITAETGVETRVIGWVHSHPHITVLPSHVDLRTQMNYQQMDQGFLGLIFAVFQDDAKTQVGRIEVTAFQSVEGGGASYYDPIQFHDEDGLGGHVEIPAHDASAAAGGYVRKGIPISLIRGKGEGEEGPTSISPPTTEAMRCVVSLQEILMKEEKLCYEAAAEITRHNNQGVKGGDVHALYNSAVYSKALASLIEESALPLVNTLESILDNLKRQKHGLSKRNQSLEGRLSEKGRSSYMAAAADRLKASKGDDMMDLDEKEGVAVNSNSRNEILAAAAKGLRMKMIDGGQSVLVRLKREYPAAGGVAFGVWRLQIGDAISGTLKSLEEAHSLIKFVIVDADGNNREYRFEANESSNELWIRRVAPLIPKEV